MCSCSCEGLNELNWTVKASPKKVKLLNPHFSARVSVTLDLLLAKQVWDNSRKPLTDCSTKVKRFIQKNHFVRKLSWVRRKQGDQLFPVTWLCYSEKKWMQIIEITCKLYWDFRLKLLEELGAKANPFSWLGADKRDKWRRSEISLRYCFAPIPTYSMGNQ